MKEVRLRSHLDGGEGVVILRHGWGREEVCAVTCAGSPPAPGDRIRGRIHIFQSCFCPFNCKIYILSVYYYFPPPLVALNLRCVKWFRGRKTCISNAALSVAQGWWHLGLLVLSVGPGQAQALFPQLCLSPVTGDVYFFPQLEII